MMEKISSVVILIVSVWALSYIYKENKRKMLSIKNSDLKPGHLYVAILDIRGERDLKLYYNDVELIALDPTKDHMEIPLTEPGVLKVTNGRRNIKITQTDLESYVVIKVIYERGYNWLRRVKIK